MNMNLELSEEVYWNDDSTEKLWWLTDYLNRRGNRYQNYAWQISSDRIVCLGDDDRY